MGHGSGRPVKTRGRPYGPGGAARIEATSHGLRPGSAHQSPREWAAARLEPSKFQRMGRGPARPLEIAEDEPRPDPVHHIFKLSQPGPAHHIFKSLGPTWPGPDKWPMTSPGFK